MVEKLIKDAFNGKSGSLEFEMIALKGTHRWCEIYVVPFKNVEGAIVSALGVTRDITERKKRTSTAQTRSVAITGQAHQLTVKGYRLRNG